MGKHQKIWSKDELENSKKNSPVQWVASELVPCWSIPWPLHTDTAPLSWSRLRQQRFGWFMTTIVTPFDFTWIAQVNMAVGLLWAVNNQSHGSSLPTPSLYPQHGSQLQSSIDRSRWRDQPLCNIRAPPTALPQRLNGPNGHILSTGIVGGCSILVSYNGWFIGSTTIVGLQ